MGSTGGSGGARGEAVDRPVLSIPPAPAASRTTNTMRWARTGTHLTRKEWLDDYLAGLLWFVGIFVVLGVLAHLVRVVAG
jgi:hypothetical protein